MSGDEDQEGTIMEYLRIGNSVKVTAIDIATMREVSIVGSSRATKKELTDVAIQKLRYVMGRDSN